jgi:hypothetical protein
MLVLDLDMREGLKAVAEEGMRRETRRDAIVEVEELR